MGVFDAALDRMFAVMGEDATYTPTGGSATTISVIPAREDVLPAFGDTRILKDDRAVFEVRKSEVSAPQAGEPIVFDSTSYAIKTFRTLDDRRHVWLIECKPG